ncbi:uncharacterized protein C8Q71DRAFT_817188 [Rhodofomes roseus]|uniref:NAD(P)-binding protein n=1 Tax=Rhodofomes roseus TaxID=34475 RepID=A0ABQ8K2V6_9APHY|nr:uncharacterized protein C8Q71DRAFT_817188 [Rhodofomes roseus]KAH9830834.1 hypothetical protein C8Q71DRAFT_817188 [Rhodofomes roseus]
MSADVFAFTNRIVLISGGSSGIGAYLAQGLAVAGDGNNRIYIVGRRAAALASTASASAHASSIIPLSGDVSSIAGCQKVAADFVEAEKNAGVAEDKIQLDLLVNNAGILRGEGSAPPEASVEELAESLLKASDDDWRVEMAVNVGSIQWLSASLLLYLVRAASTGKRDGRGNIVVNTSVSAFNQTPPFHLYCASKAAAHSVTQSLARALTPRGVRVNSIAPANVPSEMNSLSNPASFVSKLKDSMPVGRIGEPEDVVAAVVYLASRAGSYVSGTVIAVDGGVLLT